MAVSVPRMASLLIMRMGPRVHIPSSTGYAARRSLSVQANHSSFPASLLYYSSRLKSGLFSFKNLAQHEDEPYNDAVVVSADGLVYPNTAEDTSSRLSHALRNNMRSIANSSKQ